MITKSRVIEFNLLFNIVFALFLLLILNKVTGTHKTDHKFTAHSSDHPITLSITPAFSIIDTQNYMFLSKSPPEIRHQTRTSIPEIKLKNNYTNPLFGCMAQKKTNATPGITLHEKSRAEHNQDVWHKIHLLLGADDANETTHSTIRQHGHHHHHNHGQQPKHQQQQQPQWQ